MIDFLAQQNAATKRVQDLLASRPQGIEDALASTKSNIQTSRNQALGSTLQGNLGSIAQGYNLPGISADTSNIQRNLASNLNVGQAGQRMGLNQDRIQAVYNQALDQATNAGQNRQAAEDFARQHMNLEIQQQQEALMNEMARQQETKRTDLGINFAQQGLDLYQRYNTPQVDYQSALMRVLTGLPVQIGTGMYLQNQWRKNQPYGGTLPTNSNIYGYNPMADINPMLQGQTAFSANINPMTGKRVRGG